VTEERPDLQAQNEQIVPGSLGAGAPLPLGTPPHEQGGGAFPPPLQSLPHATRAELQRARRPGNGNRAKRNRTPSLVLGWVLVVLVLVGSLFVFWPQALGGSVAYVMMRGNSMVPTLHDGDLIVARRQAGYQPDDVIVYRVPAGQPGAEDVVIHRIVAGTGATGFVTQGDNTLGADPVHPKTTDVLGRVWFYVPGALALVVLGAVAGTAILIVALVARRRRRTKRAAEVSRYLVHPPVGFLSPQAGPVSSSAVAKAAVGLAGPATPAALSIESAPPPAPVPPMTPQPEPEALGTITRATGPRRESTPVPVVAMGEDQGEVVRTTPTTEDPLPAATFHTEMFPEPVAPTHVAEQPTVVPDDRAAPDAGAAAEPVSWAIATPDPVTAAAAAEAAPAAAETPVAPTPVAGPAREPEPASTAGTQVHADSYWDRTRARRARDVVPPEGKKKRKRGRRER
jgi:signal peptidase I